MSRPAFLDLISGELTEIERRMQSVLDEDAHRSPAAAEAMRRIVDAGGKRLRPALVILGTRLGAASAKADEGMFNVAVAIEFLHNATLIHDDLIDNSLTRRGRPALHVTHGSAVAVVIGDYYLARAFGIAAEAGGQEVLAHLAGVVTAICSGELMQVATSLDLDQSQATYYSKIEAKTAALLESCCHAAAVVGGFAAAQRQALVQCGREMGIAFQIADDLLDYSGGEEQMGKPVGADLREGTVTLPLLLALEEPAVGKRIRALLQEGRPDDAAIREVVELVRESRGMAQATRVAEEYVERAERSIAIFPESPYREALILLARYAGRRRA